MEGTHRGGGDARDGHFEITPVNRDQFERACDAAGIQRRRAVGKHADGSPNHWEDNGRCPACGHKDSFSVNRWLCVFKCWHDDCGIHGGLRELCESTGLAFEPGGGWRQDRSAEGVEATRRVNVMRTELDAVLARDMTATDDGLPQGRLTALGTLEATHMWPGEVEAYESLVAAANGPSLLTDDDVRLSWKPGGRVIDRAVIERHVRNMLRALLYAMLAQDRVTGVRFTWRDAEAWGVPDKAVAVVQHLLGRYGIHVEDHGDCPATAQCPWGVPLAIAAARKAAGEPPYRGTAYRLNTAVAVHVTAGLTQQVHTAPGASQPAAGACRNVHGKVPEGLRAQVRAMAWGLHAQAAPLADDARLRARPARASLLAAVVGGVELLDDLGALTARAPERDAALLRRMDAAGLVRFDGAKAVATDEGRGALLGCGLVGQARAESRRLRERKEFYDDLDTRIAEARANRRRGDTATPWVAIPGGKVRHEGTGEVRTVADLRAVA
jgi:hypothetical protein